MNKYLIMTDINTWFAVGWDKGHHNANTIYIYIYMFHCSMFYWDSYLKLSPHFSTWFPVTRGFPGDPQGVSQAQMALWAHGLDHGIVVNIGQQQTIAVPVVRGRWCRWWRWGEDLWKSGKKWWKNGSVMNIWMFGGDAKLPMFPDCWRSSLVLTASRWQCDKSGTCLFRFADAHEVRSLLLAPRRVTLEALT